MTQKEIIEGNKLIAKFLFPNLEEECKADDFLIEKLMFAKMLFFFKNYGRLEFHSKWDWLISACRKWDMLEVEDKNLVEYIKLCDQLDNTVAFYEIEPSFQQLVKCIKQYNKWKKK
ncbi:MAG: hypothetical protein ABIH82_00695 [Candidatus Woesearchaeota archaeon]